MTDAWTQALDDVRATQFKSLLFVERGGATLDDAVSDVVERLKMWRDWFDARRDIAAVEALDRFIVAAKVDPSARIGDHG